ncbi:hypothetical protein G6F68_014338 [Rhizopus microsporus]|nr:hypothetical protein G6F68_014338 [Rhizopus microsporus]
MDRRGLVIATHVEAQLRLLLFAFDLGAADRRPRLQRAGQAEARFLQRHRYRRAAGGVRVRGRHVAALRRRGPSPATAKPSAPGPAATPPTVPVPVPGRPASPCHAGWRCRPCQRQ